MQMRYHRITPRRFGALHLLLREMPAVKKAVALGVSVLTNLYMLAKGRSFIGFIHFRMPI
jgi:hypothetical protein